MRVWLKFWNLGDRLIEKSQVVESLEGPGLLLDFHGQAHKQNSTEIGYLISSWSNIKFRISHCQQVNIRIHKHLAFSIDLSKTKHEARS